MENKNIVFKSVTINVYFLLKIAHSMVTIKFTKILFSAGHTQTQQKINSTIF